MKIDVLLDHPARLKEASATPARVARDYRIDRSLARLEEVYAGLIAGEATRPEAV